jgi:hypothetical protein
MEWRELVGRTIVAVVATRGGRPDETIPNVLHLRFSDGSAAIISCNWASHERPWLDLEAEPQGLDPWLPDLPEGEAFRRAELPEDDELP